jgi:hypothetical protein
VAHRHKKEGKSQKLWIDFLGLNIGAASRTVLIFSSARPPKPDSAKSWCLPKPCSLCSYARVLLCGYEQLVKKQTQFPRARMNVNVSCIKDYENIPASGARKNKANQSQFLEDQMIAYHSCPASRCGINSRRNPDFLMILDSASSAP